MKADVKYILLPPRIALTSLLPEVYTFHNGAVTYACPGPKTPVVSEVRQQFED